MRDDIANQYLKAGHVGHLSVRKSQNKSADVDAPVLKNRGNEATRTAHGNNGGLAVRATHDFSRMTGHGNPSRSTLPIWLQPKLELGQPNDQYEKEADAVAENVIHGAQFTPAISRYVHGNEPVQRDEQNTDDEADKKSKLQQQPAQPDFLTLRTPFVERNAMHLWDFSSALSVWNYNLGFFKRLGLNDGLAGKAANLTAPLFINAQLKAGNPTWWEATDRELNTSSIMGSVPVFSFDSNFSGWKFMPALQKKGVDGAQQWSAKSSENYAAVGTQIQSMQGAGEPLPARTRHSMEGRFGTDFSRVKIHTDSRAIQLSRQLHAHAFTVGNDIYFNRGRFSPESSHGERLLAHELTHTIQQGGGQDAASTSVIQREEDAQMKAIREKLRKGGTLTAAEMRYVEDAIGKEVVAKLMGGLGPQIAIDYDSTRKPADIDRRFHGKLELHLSGVRAAIAKSLEGSATAEIDFSAKVEQKKAVITISPPTEENRMAAMIRALLFSGGNAWSLDVDFPLEYFQYLQATSLLGAISVSLAGPGSTRSGALMQLTHPSIPSGTELIITIAPTLRAGKADEKQGDLPNDHWTLTPRPRVFGSLGYRGLNENSAIGTVGVDVPLGYDTKNPWLYGGLGARASLDSSKSARIGGNVFAGLNLDPLMLQMGIGAGVAFLPAPVVTPEGPAQTVLYCEIEGIVSYKVLPHVDVLLLLSAGGGQKGTPAFATVEGGLGYRF